MRKILLSVWMLIVIVAVNAQTTEWVTWRGQNSLGIAKSKNIDVSKLDSTQVLWQADIGFSSAAMAVKNGKCYMVGQKEVTNDSDTSYVSTIYCVNDKTGESIWHFDYPADERPWTGPRTSPIIDDGNLYYLGADGDLFCLDAENGKQKWQRDIHADSLGKITRWGYSSTPIVHNNLLLFNIGKAGCAINKNNGEVVWRSSKDGSNYSSVVLFSYKGKTAALCSSDSTLSAVEPETGKLIWQTQFDPVIIHSTVFDNKIFTGTELYDISGEEPKLLWRKDSIAASFQSGIVVDGYAYQYATPKRKKHFLNCIDLKTGEVTWKIKEKDCGVLMAVDDKLVLLGGKGNLKIVELNPKEYKEISEYQYLTHEKKREQMCWTMPTFANDKLYIRNYGGKVACVDLSKK